VFAGSEPDWERRRLVLELKASGLTFEEIGAQLGVSRQAVHKQYWAAMRAISDEHREEAEVAFSEALLREQEAIAQARRIVTALCLRCSGLQKVEPRSEREQAEPRDSEGRIICPSCQGSGFLHAPSVRLQALAAIQRSNEHIAKLYDFYGPARTLVPGRYDFKQEVMQMSDEEIERAVEALMAPLQVPPEGWDAAEGGPGIAGPAGETV
jgi:predicted transcriptional regulator